MGSSYQSRKGNTGSQEKSGKFDTIFDFALPSLAQSIHIITHFAIKIIKKNLNLIKKICKLAENKL